MNASSYIGKHRPRTLADRIDSARRNRYAGRVPFVHAARHAARALAEVSS